MFKQNEGILDRTLRVTLALVLIPTGIFLLGGLQGSILGLVIASIGGLALITGITGVCPLYIPFGINTLEKEKGLIARCMSMMAGFRQGSAIEGYSGAGHRCNPCPPSFWDTYDHHEHTGHDRWIMDKPN